MLAQKRGQLNLLSAGVVTLVLAGVLFILGLVMLNELHYDSATDVGSVENDTTGTITDVGGVYLTLNSSDKACGLNSINVLSATNFTDYTNEMGNYSINDYTGEIKFISTDTVDEDRCNNTILHVNYTYQYDGSEACTASNKTVVGQGKLGDYVDLIIIALVITIIISLLVAILGARQTR